MAASDFAVPTPARPLRLGTRRSPLAMRQAEMVADALRAVHRLADEAVMLVPMTASGDVVQDRPLAEIGGKALWTRELDKALAAGAIDAAVHSMKDVETIRPTEFRIAAMLPRADVRDRLIGAESVAALPTGATVGTASPRRAAQLKALRPDLAITLFRGNVATRLAKIDAGEADATLLAAAGLERLGIARGAPIAVDAMLPAPAQGAIGVEACAGREELCAFLAAIDDADTHGCISAERGLLYCLGADCHSPVAALAVCERGGIRLRAQLLAEDGSAEVRGETRFAPGDRDAPETLAADLLARAPDAVRRLFAGA